MPDQKKKPVSASESSASDEAQLELDLQKQFEEEIARIFDESIYSDLEVVCGKLKILTHTCILKARTNTFYNKLENIFHLNIGREIFDEIYSFISDAYTECDITNQEKEILIFLESKIVNENYFKSKKDLEDIDRFSPPNSVSPFADNIYQQVGCLSPTTELTKEYYALVHIEGNFLEQELIEQDALSSAFHSIIKSQDKDTNEVLQHNKPTSLALISSHLPKTITHSSHCDIYNIISCENDDVKKNTKISQPYEGLENSIKKVITSETLVDKILDPIYSPDSLITDDPSYSSDFLSAAYTCSPAVGSSGCLLQLNVGESRTKMENITLTSTDSAAEDSFMLESTSSGIVVTLSTMSVPTMDSICILTNSQETISSPEPDDNQKIITSTSRQSFEGPVPFNEDSLNDMATFSGFNRQSNVSSGIIIDLTSREEKQRQNEEIVILLSSSASSETGSWESVFPQNITDKEICLNFINNERQYINQENDHGIEKHNYIDNQKLIKHSAPCFIDAANLVDEDQISIQAIGTNDPGRETSKLNLKHIPSKSVPCSTVSKPDLSPRNGSENIDKEYSLERENNKDTDSVQKDFLSTIFENSEDSARVYATTIFTDSMSAQFTSISLSESNSVYVNSNPHNSFAPLKSYVKPIHNESEESKKHASENSFISTHEASVRNLSVDIPPNMEMQTSSSSNLNVEKTPVATITLLTNDEANNVPNTPKPSCSSAWVIDMSVKQKELGSEKSSANFNSKEAGRKTYESLDNNEKCGQKFYIDLATLPDPLPQEKLVTKECNKGNQLFSLYIDLGENSTLKEKPSRLLSSFSNKKQVTESKACTKSKISKSVGNETNCAMTQAQDNCCNSTFEEYEFLCNDPTISISEIIALPPASIARKSNDLENERDKYENPFPHPVNEDEAFLENTNHVTHEETAKSKEQSTDLFVKLSDLDKTLVQSDVYDSNICDPRMTRSIPDKNWLKQNSQTTPSKPNEVITCYYSENAESLNRLFPHLKNEFSKSMPVSLHGRTQSPLQSEVSPCVAGTDQQVSDVSEISSVQSSMCPSVIENGSTEDTSQPASIIGNCHSRLGQDLLRMFLEEIAPDVIVQVSGKQIKAHKCILSSRCQFFARYFSGKWNENPGNIIKLPPFSYNTVHFVLCHIYSGMSNIPESIGIVELSTLADFLGLDGLKEAIMFKLKVKYCHYFHRPCQVCTAGVLECFPLASMCGLDDLYRKCLKWITKYFTQIWPTKAFATLSKDLLDKCYQEHIVNLTHENLIDEVYGCGITVASLQNSRWAENVARMCRRLVNAAAHFAAPRLLAVLEQITTIPDAPQSAKQTLDDCLAAAIEWAPPDETCRAYAFLSNFVKEIKNLNSSKPDLITNGNQYPKVPENSNHLLIYASSWRLQCEGALVRAAPRVVDTQAFKDLPSDLRRRLRELGCIMYGPQTTPLSTSTLQDRKCRSAYHSKPKRLFTPSTTRSLDMEKVRNSFIPYHSKPVTPMGTKRKVHANSELKDNRKTNRVITPKVRSTKAQEERAKFNQSKAATPQDRLAVAKSAPMRTQLFKNASPRYLEPRLPKEKESKVTPKKFISKVVSSSESSRNSSPVQCRKMRATPMMANQKCEHKADTMSQDSLATTSRPRTAEPSTESLSESQNTNKSKYATYTKTKHTAKGSVDSVTSKYQGCSSSLNTNIKTKIPVYLNQASVSTNGTNKPSTSGKTTNNQAIAKGKTKSCDRKISGSLMNATKSSTAKIVPKLTKESQPNNPQLHKPYRSYQSKCIPKPTNRREDVERLTIPVIERSGTFSKDVPTFGGKTDNINDQ